MHLDRSNHSLQNAHEGRRLRPLDGALDLTFCLHQAVHPVQGPHLFTVIQPPALHLPALPIQEPSVASWPLKPSAGIAFVLLGVPLGYTEMSSVPLAFTERLRDDTSLPLPLFLRHPRRRPLESSSSFRAILDSGTACAFLCLTPIGMLDIDSHPPNQYRTVSFASNLLPGNLSCHITMLFGPILLPPSFARELELVPAILPLSAVHARALLPTSSNTLIGSSAPAFFLTAHGHTIPHINSCLISENQ